MSTFEQGLDAAMNDLLEYPAEVVLEIAKESEQTPSGLASKFCQGYRRFAYHHMTKVCDG